jgi:hypothetical protein
MEPNTVLAQAQAAMRRANALPGRNTENGRIQDLADAARHYAELDDWIGRGGFLPAQWANRPGKEEK